MISLFSLVLLGWSAAAAHVMRPYNFVNVTSIESAAALDLFFQRSADAGQAVLLGVADPECWGLLENPYFKAAHRNSPAEYVNIATVSAAYFPLPLSGCAQLFWYPVGSTLHSPVLQTNDMEREALTVWMSQAFRTAVVLRNGFSFDIQVHYVTESDDSGMDGGGAFQAHLAPGQEMDMQTFLGHVFSARAASPDGSHGWTVDFFIVSGAREYTFSAHSYFNGDESCARRAADAALDSEAGAGAGACPNLPEIMHERTFASWHRTRLALNFLQPQVVRPVTSAGFRKMQVPAATYAWLRGWYDGEKRRRDADIEGSAGPCMNQKESPSMILHLPLDLKSRMAAELLPVLQAWYEEPQPLQMTSIYGVRTYTNGSVLAMHVDTLQTHVVSAIINVDQDVDEPWLLKILDHSDTEVDLEMAAGDMVLYESAKLLHGRPVPMNGRRYENIFIHYRPESGWEEYEDL